MKLNKQVAETLRNYKANPSNATWMFFVMTLRIQLRREENPLGINDAIEGELEELIHAVVDAV